MLHAAPTKKGAGIELFGHREDLQSLHETIHFLCSGTVADSDEHEHALFVAYEVRKAIEGQRESRSLDSEQLLGTRITWPQILFYVSYFRHLAAYRPTTKNHQSDLMRLEACLENALVEYDPRVGSELLTLYPRVGAVSREFLPSYISDLTYAFLYDGGSGKMRFRRLPALVQSMMQWSGEYSEYALVLEQQAKKFGCNPRQLQDQREWPDFEW